jgi:hypothetical protein
MNFRHLPLTVFSDDDPMGGGSDDDLDPDDTPAADTPATDPPALTREQVDAWMKANNIVGLTAEDYQKLQKPTDDDPDEYAKGIEDSAVSKARQEVVAWMEAKDELEEMLKDELVTAEERAQVKAAIKNGSGPDLQRISVLLGKELYSRTKNAPTRNVPNRSEDLSGVPSQGEAKREYDQMSQAGLLPAGTTFKEYQKVYAQTAVK